VINDAGIKQGEICTKEGKKIPAKKGFYPNKLYVEPFLQQGFAVATVYYRAIEPDFVVGFKYGIRGCYLKPEETKLAPIEWGAISAWTWGLSRAMDYFETDR
jgi:hypothetical protein